MIKSMKREVLIMMILYFTANLSADYFIEGEVDFTATILGTLVFGLIISLGSVILKNKKKRG